LQKTLKFRENNKLIILLKLSIEATKTPKTCKDFQKEETISIKVIFFLINRGVILRKVGVFGKRSEFRERLGYFEKGRVFRGNGYLFEILGEYSKRARFIQKRNSSQKTTFMQSRW
jgi:hypothetical protein